VASNIVYNIPFPYEQFTDTQFIVTDQGSGLFIPDDYYTRINEYQIQFPEENKIGITKDSEIKFTFFHIKNKRWIGKVEYHLPVEFTGQKQFNLKASPYNQLVNLHKRTYVFYNRRRQSKGTQYYINDDQGQIVLVNKRLKSLIGDRVDVLIVYSAGVDNGAIQELPQSGYIELSKYEIDRNYNPNLMAVFVNGKLVDRKNIIQMTNSLYKIGTDIKSRYNIEVKNLSPKINSMVPYYKQHYNQGEEKQLELSKHITCRINVPEIPDKGRQHFPFQFSPIYFFPDLIDDPELWLNLILRKSVANYTLQFFENDKIETPSDINVIMQLRIRTYRDFIRNSATSTIICVIPATVHSISKDEILVSIQLKTIVEMDTMRDYYHKEMIYDFIDYLTLNKIINQIPNELQIDLENESMSEILTKLKNQQLEETEDMELVTDLINQETKKLFSQIIQDSSDPNYIDWENDKLYKIKDKLRKQGFDKDYEIAYNVLYKLIIRFFKPLVTKNKHDPNYIDWEVDSIRVIQKKMKNIKKNLNLELYNEGAIDGIIGRFQANRRQFNAEDPIYYTLTSDKFDHENKVNVFRWTISTEKNSTGNILWDKEVSLEPDNKIELLERG